MKPLLVISTFLTVAAAIYGIPTGVEFLLLRWNVSPWLASVVLGDLVGCAFLYLFGFRALAVKIYVISVPVKAVLLWAGAGRWMFFATDLVPAVIAASLVSRAAIRWLTEPHSFEQ